MIVSGRTDADAEAEGFGVAFEGTEGEGCHGHGVAQTGDGNVTEGRGNGNGRRGPEFVVGESGVGLAGELDANFPDFIIKKGPAVDKGNAAIIDEGAPGAAPDVIAGGIAGEDFVDLPIGGELPVIEHAKIGADLGGVGGELEGEEFEGHFAVVPECGEGVCLPAGVFLDGRVGNGEGGNSFAFG